MVKRVRYVPERGDIVWVDFNPQAGHEQAGRRPALIVSPQEYNEKVGLSIACPLTRNIKGYPFEVVVNTKSISGVILSDHVKSIETGKPET